MNKVLKNSWALFLGMGFIMMAYGFQGSLLGVRVVQEEFSLTSTGFMMSGYFVGYFIGAATIPNIISRVCLLYTSPSPRDRTRSRMPSSA